MTIAHSRTSNLREICLSADILIAALGIPGFVKGDMVKEGVVVVDVGINKMEDPGVPKGIDWLVMWILMKFPEKQAPLHPCPEA